MTWYIAFLGIIVLFFVLLNESRKDQLGLANTIEVMCIWGFMSCVILIFALLAQGGYKGE